jgi:protein-disulfide isomerase
MRWIKNNVMSILRIAVNSNDHIQGKPTAPIELVEYGDYQCPHCGHAYPIIKNIQLKMGSELKFVYRNFPLAEIHPDAVNAALASEAAGLQNKFWEMHDHLFEHQNRLNESSLIKYAEQLDLDIEQFNIDRRSEALIQKVETDFESGVRSGVNGTPSFFINGEKYNGDWEEEIFLDYLKSLLR